MGFGAVIVAGKQPPPSGSFAPLVQAGSISVIKRIIYTLQQAKVSPIVVMTGYEADQLERHVERTGVICMRDVDYESTSELETLKQGIAEIQNQCQGIVVPSVQTPFFKGEKRSFARRGIQKSSIKKDLDSWMHPKSSSLLIENIF